MFTKFVAQWWALALIWFARARTRVRWAKRQGGTCLLSGPCKCLTLVPALWFALCKVISVSLLTSMFLLIWEDNFLSVVAPDVLLVSILSFTARSLCMPKHYRIFRVIRKHSWFLSKLLHVTSEPPFLIGTALQQNSEWIGGLPLPSSVSFCSILPAPTLFSASCFVLPLSKQTCSQERDKFIYFEIINKA